MADPAGVNPVNIVTIGAFATVVVGGLMSFIYWLVKQHSKERKETTKRFEELQSKTNSTMEHVAETNQHLKESVDNLSARSKTETDFATLLLEVLKTRNKSP